MCVLDPPSDIFLDNCLLSISPSHITACQRNDDLQNKPALKAGESWRVWDVTADEYELSVKWSESLSAVQLFATPWTIQSMNSPGQNAGMGSCSLLPGIFPTQWSNPGLPVLQVDIFFFCRWILYQLSHKGSPKLPLKRVNPHYTLCFKFTHIIKLICNPQINT